MTRTQISLTEEQHRFLSELSQRTGESISAIIREAVDRLRTTEGTPQRRAMRLVGAFEADRGGLSLEHDDVVWGSGPASEGGTETTTARPRRSPKGRRS